MDFSNSFPFFQSRDSALQSAYSYGDPRGGLYPEPPSLNALYDDPEVSDQENESSEAACLSRSEVWENDAPAVDPDYTASEAEDVEDESELPTSDSERFAPQLAQRGVASRGRGASRGGRGASVGRGSSRGRGRGRGKGRGRPSTRGRGLVRTAKAAFDGDDDGDGRSRKRRRRSRADKKLEPSPEFRRLNGLVTEAYMNSDWDTAFRYALEAIQLNPEVFPLHSTIAEILLKKGRAQDAMGALFAGVHSSRDPANWWYVIDRLNELGENSEESRIKLGYSYTALVRLKPHDYQARLGKLKFYRERSLYRRAKNECQTLLGLEPDDGSVLLQLAELCSILEVPDEALQRFDEFIAHCLKDEEPGRTHLTWTLILSYSDLLIQQERYDEAIQQLKSLSRWLLGRADEEYWDLLSDDREWDDFDEPRRIRVPEYTQYVFEPEQYGLGLPIELRIKLGNLRLQMGDDHFGEALRHFESLTADENIEVADYVDLYREAADALREAGYHSEALQFYEPLRDVMDILDSGFYFDIAICYQALGRVSNVRSAIRSIRQSDRTADAHIGLAKLYQSQGKLDLMWRLIRELRKMGKAEIVRNAGLPTTRPSSLTAREEGPQIPPSLLRRLRRDPKQRKIPKKPIERAKEEQVQNIVVRAMFDDMQSLQPAADASDTEATMEWLSLASELFEVFRSQRAFFPRDKAKPYKGALGNYVSIPDGDILDADSLEFLLPKEYRKISFDDWTDLLMRYAICVADRGNRELCWTIIKVCTDANAIYSDTRRHLVVRITALRCAIAFGDESKVCEEARWHVKDSPFSTDAIRVFSAANRATRGTTEFYRAGPEQKYFMRMLKVMDFALLDEENRSTFHFTDGNRVAWTEDGKGDGNPYNLKAHDPNLLGLYAHMMSIAGSSAAALNYYYRAYVLKPHDPLLNLCIGLSYLSFAFKRQSHNRQFHLQQGMTFVIKYYELRIKDNVAIHIQEAEFNMGMAWQALGLPHLALSAYGKCMRLSSRVQEEGEQNRGQRGDVEDFAAEAAFAMRSILAMNGDAQAARNVTKEWLII